MVTREEVKNRWTSLEKLESEQESMKYRNLYDWERERERVVKQAQNKIAFVRGERRKEEGGGREEIADISS